MILLPLGNAAEKLGNRSVPCWKGLVVMEPGKNGIRGRENHGIPHGNGAHESPGKGNWMVLCS